MVPNAPGGGYDTTARVLASALDRVAGAEVDVFNLPGGSGVTGLARLAREAGNPALLMMMGLGVVGAASVADRAADITATTPVARLLGEPDLVLVRSDSPFASLEDVVTRWTGDPRSFVIGGGSLAGGPDHLATYTLADALGIPAGAVRYRSYDGGGPLVAALLAGGVDVVMSGVLESIDQVRAGAVRALAVTGPARVPGLATPTLRELGIDGELENWRGLLAPPDVPTSRLRRLVDLVEEATATSVWRDAVDANGWTPRWLAGEEFASFLSAEERRTASLLSRLGQPRTGG